MEVNKAIISQFIILRDYYAKTGDTIRKNAYTNAIRALKDFKYPINKSNVKGLILVKGIGKNSVEKITQFLNTGKISQVEDIILHPPPMTEKEKSISKLKQIWGIGDVRANELYMAGITSIDDLRKYPEYLTESGKIFLEYLPYLQEKVPRETIFIFELSVRVLINKFLGKNYLLEVAGSYRRGAPSSGDVDMIITSENFSLNDVVNLLEDFYLIRAKLSGKSQKFLGIGSVKRCGLKPSYFRFDIEFLPRDEWVTGLFYFTGSGEYVRDVRLHAKKLGYTLNEHGLYRGKRKINIGDERELLNVLGLPYVEIENR